MKIRLMIIDEDEEYLKKVVFYFENQYNNVLEIHAFTDVNVAIDVLKKDKIDVCIVDSLIEFPINIVPKNCGFAYLISIANVNSDNKTIFKYQKMELIYKQILDLFTGEINNTKTTNDSDNKIICFSSPCGGTGNTTLAIACAMHYAKKNQKVLYVNIEKYGDTSSLLTGQGNATFSDMIFSIKSKKGNLEIKTESCVRQDESGVFFFANPKLSLDMLELNNDEIIEFLDTLQKKTDYAYIILDMDLMHGKDIMKIYNIAEYVIMVTDGCTTANTKLERCLDSIDILEQESNFKISSKIRLMYNKFSNKHSCVIERFKKQTLVVLPKYDCGNNKQLVNEVSNIPNLDIR